MSAMNGHHAKSQRELARRLKISRSTVARLVEDGLEPSNGHYPLDQARKLLSIRALRGRAIASDTDALELKKQKLSLDVAHAQLDLEIAKGEWVRKVDVISEWRKRVVEVRNSLKALGRQLAPQLAHQGCLQIQAALDLRIIEILKSLAHPQHYPIEALEQDLHTTHLQAKEMLT